MANFLSPLGFWDVQRLREKLLPIDMEEIVKIPVYRIDKEDQWE